MLEEAIDRCVQCGFCLQSCPTYRLFDNEESSPRGRIALAKAVLQGEMQPDAASLRTFDECLGCRACEAACPSGVHYADVLLYGKQQLNKALARERLGSQPWHVRMMLWTIRSAPRVASARRAWRRYGSAAISLVRRLRPKGPPFSLLAALPQPAPLETPAIEGAPEVAIHRGCLMNVFWEGTNARAVLLLRQVGVAVELMPESTGCCGALHAHQGDVKTARALGRNVIEGFERSGARRIISLAGGCGAFLKEYPEIFPDGEWHVRAQALAAAVTDVTSLLAAQGAQPNAGGGCISYQDSCHLRNGLGVIAPPRELLGQSGEYRELPSAGQCCGSAGVYNLIHPETSKTIIQGKIAELKEVGAGKLVTANPGCELQWRFGVLEAGADVEVCHIVDYLYHQGLAGQGGQMPAANASERIQIASTQGAHLATDRQATDRPH